MRPDDLDTTLGLEPHPEGGSYVETWRSSTTLTTADGRVRPASTLIHFRLRPGESSAWHRVRSDEIWLAHTGQVVLELGGSGDMPVPDGKVVLGVDVLAGQSPQVLVPADEWQRTLPGTHDALVSCLVSPGFDFDDFELANSDS